VATRALRKQRGQCSGAEWLGVGVPAVSRVEANPSSDPASHPKLTAMGSPVMRAAENDEVLGLVTAALGTRP
jgi:hypothetical protein